MEGTHEERLRIRWRDVDAYGHVNNAVYLTYLEEARDAWVRATFGEGFDFVIVRVAIDFRSELTLADREVLVRCSGAGYGRSSIRTREVVLASDGRLAAEAQSVIVAHDPRRRQARPLTDEERERLDARIAASG